MVHSWGREPGLGQLRTELRWSPGQPSVWAGLSGGLELSAHSTPSLRWARVSLHPPRPPPPPAGSSTNVRPCGDPGEPRVHQDSTRTHGGGPHGQHRGPRGHVCLMPVRGRTPDCASLTRGPSISLSTSLVAPDKHK